MVIKTDMIDKPLGEIKTWFEDAETQDIISVINYFDKQEAKQGMQAFSKQFERSEAGLYKLWSFTKYRIKYVADSDLGNYQDIKTPESLISIGIGDCKSKTIFNNKVLQCLNIPYVIRYAGYRKNGDYTHVYTVANLNGKKIIIDSTYDFFNREPSYYKKIDMTTKVRSIEGVDYSTEICKKLTELKQRQAYIKPSENIEFNSVSEGNATIQLLKRQYDILQFMQDNKELNSQAQKLIETALKGRITGCIPNELQGLAARLNQAIKKLNIPAINQGVNYEKYKVSHAKAQIALNQKGIAGFPETLCLFQDWYFEYDKINSPQSFVQNNLNGVPNSQIVGCNTQSLSLMKAKELDMYYFYGLQSKFRGNFKTSELGQDSTVVKLIQDGIIDFVTVAPNPNGNGNLSKTQLLQLQPNINVSQYLIPNAIYIPNQTSKNAFYDLMKLNVSVMSNFINETFKADNTMTNGTISPAVFYPFLDSLINNPNISGISLNNLPASVLTKKTFQDQFLGSCKLFSGISDTNIRLMSENCCIFDNAENPTDTLRKLYNIYNPNNQIQEPISAIIAAIAAAIIGIVTAIIAATSQSEQAKLEAAKVDSFAATQANFQTPTNSLFPDNLDWLPQDTSGSGGGSGSGSGGGSGSGSGGGSGSGSNAGLIAAALIAAGIAYKSKKKKNKI